MVILSWTLMILLKREDFITQGTLCNVSWKWTNPVSFPLSPEVLLCPDPSAWASITCNSLPDRARLPHPFHPKGPQQCQLHSNVAKSVEIRSFHCFAAWYQGLKSWKEAGSELITKLLKYGRERLGVWTNQSQTVNCSDPHWTWQMHSSSWPPSGKKGGEWEMHFGSQGKMYEDLWTEVPWSHKKCLALHAGKEGVLCPASWKTGTSACVRIKASGSICHLSLLYLFPGTATSFLSEFLLPSVQSYSCSSAKTETCMFGSCLPPCCSWVCIPEVPTPQKPLSCSQTGHSCKHHHHCSGHAHLLHDSHSSYSMNLKFQGSSNLKGLEKENFPCAAF